MIELQDVLDVNGHETGERLPKSEIFARGLWRLVVHVWLVDSDGEVLIQRRAQNKGKGIFDGLWDVTVGGGVKAGEESATAASRELEEELGIVAAPDDLEKVGRYKLPKIIPETGQQMNDFSDTFFLRRDVERVDIHPDPREVSLVRKVKINEIVDQTAHPQYGKLWVPHGPVYYADVARIIMGKK